MTKNLRRLKRRERAIVAITAAMVFAIGSVWFHNATRSMAQKHLDRLDYLRMGPFVEPSNAREWVSMKGVRYAGWVARQRLSGKLASYQEWADSLEAEEQKLVELGCFERRWLLLPRRGVIDHPRLRGVRASQTRFTIYTDAARPWEVRVTAPHADVEEFRAAVDLIAR